MSDAEIPEIFAKVGTDLIRENIKLQNQNEQLLQALIEAREMLITKGMKEDSVGLIGINNVIKKATE